MSGPRILLIVVLALGALLWAALRDDPGSEHERGQEETRLALAAAQAELEALDEPYQQLARRGLMLDLKAEHDAIRSGLAVLRARRMRLGEDTSLARHEILPAYRELVTESDELLAHASSLRARVEARYEFILESSPLLTQARAYRDRLLAAGVTDPVLARQVGSSVGRFAELEGFARRADTLMHQNAEQGTAMAGATINGLKEYLDQVVELVETVEALPPEGR